MNWQINIYVEMFHKLKRGHCHKGSLSKAKPIYLLSIIELVSYKKENKFPFDDAQLADFYKTNQRIYSPDFKSPIINPFFHLGSEPFYELVWKSELCSHITSHTPSAKYLRENLLYAKLDDELWDLLQVNENRQYLKNVIINSYLK